jgi:hypothetical protein
VSSDNDAEKRFFKFIVPLRTKFSGVLQEVTKASPGTYAALYAARNARTLYTWQERNPGGILGGGTGV